MPEERSCSDLREDLATHVKGLLGTEARAGGVCVVTLPLLDSNHEPVEVYVERTEKGDVVSDWQSISLRFQEHGYESQETPDDELFDRIVARLELHEDPRRGYVIPPSSQLSLADRVWRMGEAISESSSLVIKSRYSFRLNFRRVVRDYLVGQEIRHLVNKPFITPHRTVRIQFAAGAHFSLGFDTLHADSQAQAAASIARTYEDLSVLRELRSHNRSTAPIKFTVVYNQDSMIPESDRFADLSDVTDFPPIPGDAIDEDLRSAIASAESGARAS